MDNKDQEEGQVPEVEESGEVSDDVLGVVSGGSYPSGPVNISFN